MEREKNWQAIFYKSILPSDILPPPGSMFQSTVMGWIIYMYILMTQPYFSNTAILAQTRTFRSHFRFKIYHLGIWAPGHLSRAKSLLLFCLGTHSRMTLVSCAACRTGSCRAGKVYLGPRSTRQESWGNHWSRLSMVRAPQQLSTQTLGFYIPGLYLDWFTVLLASLWSPARSSPPLLVSSSENEE